MNVWIQNPFDNLPSEGYRKQRYWLMAEAFVRAGHQVTLWTSNFNHVGKRYRGLEGLGSFGGLEVRLIPTRAYRTNVSFARVRSHRAYAREWERLVESEVSRLKSLPAPDLLVTSIPTIGAAETAIRLARRFGAKVVVDVQDAWPETFERLAPRGFRWLARLVLSGLRRRAQRIYREADLVTGVCDRYRELTGRPDYYRAYLGIEAIAKPRRVGALADANVRDLAIKRPSAGAPTGQHTGFANASIEKNPRLPSHVSRPAPRPLRLVYSGNLGRTYDLETVVRGLAAEASLDIAGKGDGEAALKRLVKDLGLEDRVKFHGYLSQDELGALLHSCDIGIVPMADESFVGVPNKFADYAAAELAIVSSLGGESAALLAKYGCGESYAAGDAKDFAAAVMRLRTRLSEARQGAARLAAEEFDAAKIYDDYVNTALTNIS